MRGALEILDDRDVLSLIESLARKHMLAPEWSSTLGRILRTVVEDGHHRQLVDLLADRAADWVAAQPGHRHRARRRTLPALDPERRGRGCSANASTASCPRSSRPCAGTPTTGCAASIDAWLQDFARDMQSNPETIAKVERLKHSLLGDPQLQELAATGWSEPEGGPGGGRGAPGVRAAPLLRAGGRGLRHAG